LIGDDVKWAAELESGKCIVTAEQLEGEIEHIYHTGGDEGELTGWNALDGYYRVQRGELAVIGGHGGHGKSGWLDALLCNISHSLNWKFLMFSAENYPYGRHMRKLMEIREGKCLRKEVDGQPILMPPNEYKRAKRWVGEHFAWIDLKTASVTINKLIDVLIYNAKKYDGFVIDPWNEIEHRRGGMNETDYISMCLSLLRDFARRHNVCVWVVTHPAKTPRDRDGKFPLLSLTDLAGSYAWRAKADMGIICHREDITVDQMSLYIQKVRFKTVGRPGSVTFDYDWDSGRFLVGKECGMEPEKAFKTQMSVPF
jgi:twinkle protein